MTKTARQVIDAWHQHTVLVFRDQNLSEDDQADSLPPFGPLAQRVKPPATSARVDAPDWDGMMLITDNVDAERQAGRLARPWRDVVPHRQVLLPRPHRASFLYGIEIPSEGGNTSFSSSYAAYERAAGRAQAQARRQDGDAGPSVQRRPAASILDLKLEDIHHCASPSIVTNPGSGRKGLYVASAEHDVDRRHGPRRERGAAAAAVRHRGRPGDHLRARVAGRRSGDVGQSRLPARAHRLAERAAPHACAAAPSRASRCTSATGYQDSEEGGRCSRHGCGLSGLALPSRLR